jgi:hypothetical protein
VNRAAPSSWLALSGVAVGAAGVAASLAALYVGMRDVMVTNGGTCATGGPYAVSAGHQCGTQETVLLTAAPFVGLALTALLVGASAAWSDDRIGGLGAIVWGALFGALGWNFLDLGIHPPADMSGAGAWIACGVVFWLMALGGLVYGGLAMREYFGPADETSGGVAPGMAPPPLVRAAVNLMPGAVQAPVSSTSLLFPGAETGTPSDAGSPWIWLLTVVASAAAGAAALAFLI